MDHKLMEEGIRIFLKGMGVDAEDQHLVDTPKRVAKAWSNTFASGYKQKPEEVLSTYFEEDNYDQMIVLKDIPFSSMCAHHILPFYGKARIGYIPNKRVIGISKLARLLELYSKRLQIQEKITFEIANALTEHMEPIGVGVVLEGTHMCMTERGVLKHSSVMVTSCLLGAMRDQADTRDEFLRF